MSGAAHSKAVHAAIPKSKIFVPGMIALSDLPSDLRDVSFRIWPFKPGMEGWGAMTQADQLMFTALTDKEWDWRTLAGFEKSTGLDENVILDFLKRYSDKLERVESAEYGTTLYRLKSRWKLITEWLLNRLDQTLDYISLGMRAKK